MRRCEHLKLQTVEREVVKARTELTDLWDKCYVSQEQRTAFTAFFDGNFCIVRLLIKLCTLYFVLYSCNL